MEKFILLEKVSQYETLPDITHAPEDALVSGSQNVLIGPDGKVSTRGGYTLLGLANSATNPITASYTWQTSTGIEISLRAYDDELEIYTSALATWVRLKDSLTSVSFRFAKVYDSTEGIDILVFVDGTANLYEWSGGITTLKSATVNTITKNGTTTWAQDRFFTASTRKVVINGTEYTYTGGESTDTLTGVTPDPSGEAADSNVFQAIRTNANTPTAGFLSTGIKVLNNQLWIFSSTSRQVYVSSNTDHTSYTFSTPRMVGEGALLTLDDVPRALAVQGEDMFISAGRDFWYKSSFEQLLTSTDTIAETLNVKKLKTMPGMGSQSQEMTLEAGDYTAFITYEPALRILGNIENLENPALLNLSNPIKPDFDAADFTNGCLTWDKNRIYVSCPNDDKVLILEKKENADGTTAWFWQPPQILPVRQFAIIGGELYGHSNATPETYKLFDGTNDNEKSMNAVAQFAYRSYKLRDKLKIFDEWLTEGYISSNCVLTLQLKYEFEGSQQTLEKTIKGYDDNILFKPSVGGIIGTEPLGTGRIGTGGENAATLNPKFRVINEFPVQDFFEVGARYESDGTDLDWEIVAQGGNMRLSPNQPTHLKQ